MMSKRWVIIPAAGIGRRMQQDRPKQYLNLLGKPVLAHVLERFAGLTGVQAIVVALNPEDSSWAGMSKPLRPEVRTVAGGLERCHSVYNALTALSGQAQDEDWILVHDAARPCIRMTDVERLLDRIEGHSAGGLLGLPLTDTIKRVDSSTQVDATLDRTQLWRAQTPQVFRYRLLKTALSRVLENSAIVTDESQAIEELGYKPLLVTGSADNIKITHLQDIKTAELYLRLQMQEQEQ